MHLSFYMRWAYQLCVDWCWGRWPCPSLGLAPGGWGVEKGELPSSSLAPRPLRPLGEGVSNVEFSNSFRVMMRPKPLPRLNPRPLMPRPRPNPEFIMNSPCPLVEPMLPPNLKCFHGGRPRPRLIPRLLFPCPNALPNFLLVPLPRPLPLLNTWSFKEVKSVKLMDGSEVLFASSSSSDDDEDDDPDDEELSLSSELSRTEVNMDSSITGIYFDPFLPLLDSAKSEKGFFLSPCAAYKWESPSNNPVAALDSLFRFLFACKYFDRFKSLFAAFCELLFCCSFVNLRFGIAAKSALNEFNETREVLLFDGVKNLVRPSTKPFGLSIAKKGSKVLHSASLSEPEASGFSFSLDDFILPVELSLSDPEWWPFFPPNFVWNRNFRRCCFVSLGQASWLKVILDNRYLHFFPKYANYMYIFLKVTLTGVLRYTIMCYRKCKRHIMLTAKCL